MKRLRINPKSKYNVDVFKKLQHIREIETEIYSKIETGIESLTGLIQNKNIIPLMFSTRIYSKSVDVDICYGAFGHEIVFIVPKKILKFNTKKEIEHHFYTELNRNIGYISEDSRRFEDLIKSMADVLSDGHYMMEHELGFLIEILKSDEFNYNRSVLIENTIILQVDRFYNFNKNE